MPTTYQAFKYKLDPTPAQEALLWDWLHACRRLYNAALEQRKIAWTYHWVSITRKQQEHEITAMRAEMPEYAALHVHVLQEVVTRLDRTFQRFFQRVKQGEKAGYPRFKGVNRYHSFTFKEYHNGAYVDNGYLVVSRIGRGAGPLVASVGRHAQDGDDSPRSRWVVCLLRLCQRALCPSGKDR